MRYGPYSPAQLAHAASIQPTTLRAWRNSRGLILSAEGEGHKKHSFSDLMRVITVRRLSDDTTDVTRAVRIVNRYFDVFAWVGEWMENGNVEALRRLKGGPIVCAVPGPEDGGSQDAGRDDLKFERLGEMLAYVVDKPLPFGAVVLSFPIIVTQTQAALHRAAIETGDE